MNERRVTRFTNETALVTADQSRAELAEQLRKRLRRAALAGAVIRLEG